jgi:hypothetical protein
VGGLSAAPKRMRTGDEACGAQRSSEPWLTAEVLLQPSRSPIEVWRWLSSPTRSRTRRVKRIGDDDLRLELSVDQVRERAGTQHRSTS